MPGVPRVSRSGFYAWRQRSLSKRSRQEGRLQAEIRAPSDRTRQTYSPERLQRDLAVHGVRVGVHRIQRIRRPRWGCAANKNAGITQRWIHAMPCRWRPISSGHAFKSSSLTKHGSATSPQDAMFDL